MSSLKRTRPSALLERRVRPRKEEDSEVEDVGDFSQNESSSAEEAASQTDASEDEEADDDSDEGLDDESEEETDPKVDISQVSFGALAKAHASISNPKKKKSAHHDLKDEDIKVSIAEREAAKARAAVAAAKRTNKHAPMEVTSKKPVSRKRDIVEIPKIKARDPRFDPIPGMPEMDEARTRKAYAFLDEYRDNELKDLKAALKKEKDPRKQERLKREIISMESRKKTQERKDRERAVIEEHRRKEKELVKEGKKPFYLKRSEQKKQVLLDQFASMSKKKVEHVIERRRKKLAHKEKKDLPFARRSAASAE